MKKETLSEWSEKAEFVRASLQDEYFRMQVGLRFSKKRIGELEGKKARLAREFLDSRSNPRLLFLNCLEEYAGSLTHKSLLRLNHVRQTKVCSKIVYNGRKVCWPSWRQFAVYASDNERKQVFDDFIAKTKHVVPFVQDFFSKNRKIYSKYGLSPLDVYLEHHRLSLPRLKSLITDVGNAVKEKFRVEFSEWSQILFSRQPSYFDDYYVMRNRVFDGVPSEVERLDALAAGRHALKLFGCNPAVFQVDAVDRPKKFPSPFCSFVKIPSDVRVSYKVESPLQDALAVFHEFGHAAHASSIDLQVSYADRYVLSDGLCESFSIFFENLLANAEFWVQEVGVSRVSADDVVRRIRFSELYAMAFYVANSLLKIAQWEENLSMQEMNERYAVLLKEWIGLDVPGEYWLLHHILPEALVYVPSYLLAMMRAQELMADFRKRYGNWFWVNGHAGSDLRSFMVSGAKSSLADFSKLDASYLMRSL